MKNLYFLTMPLCVAGNLFAHSTIKIKVLERTSEQPVAGAIVQLMGENNSTTTDQNGSFEFKGLAAGNYTIKISLIGFHAKTDTISIEENESVSKTIYMDESTVNMSEITVTSAQDLGLNTLSAIDFRLRPHLTTQDLLRLVPGLFIAQHAGGGKAEQIFLRGFDVDHGTDVAISVDNMPVNMVSHAHGQGYADLHFIIPETIEKVNFAKGPYDSKVGNLNTAGSVQFQTKNYLPQNFVKTEFGSFNTYRGVAMANILNQTDTSDKRHNAFVAAEYFYSSSYFQRPQDFSRVNLFGKYAGQLNSTTNVTFSLSNFKSSWDASGQIPERAVNNGIISRFGSIDPSEGGNTSRFNANLGLTKKLDNDAVIQSNIYYIKYKFNLYSNFTFFNSDTVNGDGIFQYDDRHVFGYNGSYTKEHEFGRVRLKSTAGVDLRDDQVGLIGLANHKNRKVNSDIMRGNLHETNFSAFLDEMVSFSPKLSLNLGVRFDNFHFAYRNQMTDTADDKRTRSRSIVNPKLNLRYNPTSNIQLYVSAGSGFHSNDSRVAVLNQGLILARAISGDVGANVRIAKRLFVNAALWAMDLESELVYVGDEGVFEPSGKTRRIGVDVSARLQVFDWMFLDGDVNLAQPRFLNEPEGANYVPLAPPVTSIAGINVKSKNGITGSLRYRYLGDRPAIEDNSIIAKGYFVTDAVLSYNHKSKYQLGMMIENLFDERWKEAQFAAESRLKGEAESVNEIHFTPGTPFNLRGNFTFYF